MNSIPTQRKGVEQLDPRVAEDLVFVEATHQLHLEGSMYTWEQLRPYAIRRLNSLHGVES